MITKYGISEYVKDYGYGDIYLTNELVSIIEEKNKHKEMYDKIIRDRNNHQNYHEWHAQLSNEEKEIVYLYNNGRLYNKSRYNRLRIELAHLLLSIENE